VSTRDGRCSLVGGIEKKGIYQALVDDEEYEQNLKAAANCPMRIIRIDTGP
jgi:ferredoxin